MSAGRRSSEETSLIDQVRSQPLEITLSDLKPGDILLFKAPKKTSRPQKFIMFAQALVRKSHGSYDTMHAAVCVGHNEEGPLIAHVVGSGYKYEPLAAMFGRDHGERVTLVFRFKNEKMAQELCKVVSQKEDYKKMKWTARSGTTSFLHPSNLSLKRKSPKSRKISDSTFCSKFVIQSLKMANENLNGNESPNIRSASTVKTLENFLRKNSGEGNDYDLLHYFPKEELKIKDRKKLK